jgi:ABC-type phosphate transport system substrate-binding protein
VKSFVAGTADFAGTDAHPAAADLAAAKAGALVVPSAGVGIGIPYNLAAVPGLKLSRKALAGIFSGAVKTWNDPLIAASNPSEPPRPRPRPRPARAPHACAWFTGAPPRPCRSLYTRRRAALTLTLAAAKLPATPITVVVRSDSSGSTNILTSHLAAIDAKSEPAPSPAPCPFPCLATLPPHARARPRLGPSAATAALCCVPARAPCPPRCEAGGMTSGGMKRA